MGRKNSPSAKKELVTLITNYEEAKAENRQLYLDADQLAGIADWYASERKFEEAQEVITYGLKIHPRNTDLLIEQAYLYLDTQKLQKAKKVADSITEEFDSEVKLLKAELLLNGGKLEEAQWLLSTIADADELETIIDVVFFIFGITGFTSVEPFFGCVRVSHVQIEKYDINDCFQFVGIRYRT